VTSISPSDRSSLINGLRTLADFLENVPCAPYSASVMLVPIARYNGSADTGHVVVCTDSEALTLASAHSSTMVQRNFGPVIYKVTLAPRTRTGE
jgi:hypothetical protein